ncbi:hypothetical protein F5Y11DRAFT_350480 [Daldinia sp. FL1419]|nr:hypothetical protein F5Y11DRAFT_350480 [Daldinia sp. FL1419]
MENLAWITEVYLLLEEVPGFQRGYLSGKGEMLMDNRIELDPKDELNELIPNSAEYHCYNVHRTKGQLGAIPFHAPCFQILLWHLNHGTRVLISPHSVDLERLYSVMFGLIGDGFSLKVKTGAEKRRKGHWQYITGEEYFIANPLPTIQLLDDIGSILSDLDLLRLSPDFDLGHRVKNDPFQKLQGDIIHSICLELPAEGIPSLAKAS